VCGCTTRGIGPTCIVTKQHGWRLVRVPGCQARDVTGGLTARKMSTSSICHKRVLLIVLTLAGGLAADVWTDIAGQAVVSVAVWAAMLYLLDRVEPGLRYGLMACLVIATAGEIFLSLGWGRYGYRLGNIPLFVPPGHVLLLLLGLSLARRMSEAAANGIIVYAALYSLAAAAAGIDTLGA